VEWMNPNKEFRVWHVTKARQSHTCIQEHIFQAYLLRDLQKSEHISGSVIASAKRAALLTDMPWNLHEKGAKAYSFILKLHEKSKGELILKGERLEKGKDDLCFFPFSFYISK
jgi:hypothetical protein